VKKKGKEKVSFCVSAAVQFVVRQGGKSESDVCDIFIMFVLRAMLMLFFINFYV
jgi:hypothetical protein